MDVQVEQEIERPREDVARYPMASENEPVWIGGVKETHMVTDPPVRVGTEVARVASSMAGGSTTRSRSSSTNPAGLS